MLGSLGIPLLIASNDAISTGGMAGAAIAQEIDVGFCEAGSSSEAGSSCRGKSCATV